MPGWNNPASEVSNHCDCRLSGLQECDGSGDRVGSRVRADTGGKDDADSRRTCAESRTAGNEKMDDLEVGQWHGVWCGPLTFREEFQP